MRILNSTTYHHIYFLDQCGWGKFKPSGWLGKKIPNLARGWLRWWWSGQDFHSNVINFGSGLEHSFAFLILNVPIWPKPGKWFPHEILPLIGKMVRGNMYHREGNKGSLGIQSKFLCVAILPKIYLLSYFLSLMSTNKIASKPKVSQLPPLMYHPDLKVSKFQKQIVLFSFEPKTERNHFLVSALRI